MTEPSFPYPPTEPIPPKDFFVVKNYINLEYAHEYTIDDLASKLPSHIGREYLRIANKGWDNGSECGSSIVVYYISIEPNEKYDLEYISYKKSKENYIKRFAEWENDIRQFLKDVDEYLEWAEKEQYIIRKSYFEDLREKYSYLR